MPDYRLIEIPLLLLVECIDPISLYLESGGDLMQG